MISPTSRRRAIKSGDQRRSPVTVAKKMMPTTRSWTTIGASAHDVAP